MKFGVLVSSQFTETFKKLVNADLPVSLTYEVKALVQKIQKLTAPFYEILQKNKEKFEAKDEGFFAELSVIADKEVEEKLSLPHDFVEKSGLKLSVNDLLLLDQFLEAKPE